MVGDYRKIGLKLPGTVALTYLTASLLWILGSDRLVDWLHLPIWVQTSKGLMFVTLTSWILYRSLSSWQTRLLASSRALVQSEADQRAVNQSLRESEERYRRLVELSPEGVAVQVDGVLTLVNPTFIRLFGAEKAEQLLGRPIHELVHAQCRQAASPVLSAPTSEPVEFRFSRLDQSEFEGEVLTVSFVKQGQPAVLTLIRDVSERERIASALEQHRAHLENIISSSSDAIVAIDSRAEVLWFNPAAERCFGWRSEEAEGQAWDSFFSANVGTRRNGQRFTAEVQVHTTPLADGPIQTITLRDLSERLETELRRRELEQQLRQSQKMEALGTLAGGVAHDFNNLLTVVLGSASMIKLDHPEEVAYLDDIRHAAQRAADLTRQLLLFSRKQVMQKKTLDLNQTLANLTGILGRLLGERVTVQSSFQENLAQISADPGMVEQVLVNLVVNSRDAMPEGGVLRISTREVIVGETSAEDVLKALPGRYVCLEVKDDGLGIAAEELPLIFQPFYTTKDVGQGTGLGLATVYGIVEQHEAGLQVQSEVGRGTTFRVLFPALQRDSLDGKVRPELHLPRGQGTVLVAEDDPGLQSLIRRVLQRCGYQVILASNGSEALALWRTQSSNIEFLVTDMVMPGGVSGLELGRRLRAEKDSLRVVYTSGYSPEFVQDSALREGEQYLTKPYTPAQLANALTRSA